MTYEEILCDANTLYRAYEASVRVSKWKESVVTGIMFEGYPQRVSVYDGLQDAEEKDLLDDAGNRVEGRIVYQRI